jgi:broad specificity phosphatase PhoE
MIYLVRHAHAGNKQAWRGPDEHRPLSASGAAEARGLLTQLAPFPVTAIVSSPAVRCQQTVTELAARHELRVRVDARLGVHADLAETVDLLFSARADGTVLCTHGEVIERVLHALRAGGAPVSADAAWPKGSTWVLRGDGARITAADYLPPLRTDKAHPDLQAR